MYAPHFGLSAEPFDLVPNPAYLYLGPQYREAISALQYGVADRRGFVALIGEVGTGKTTLLYNLLADLPPGVEAAFVSYADQPFPGLLSLLLTDLSVAHDATSEPAMLAALQAHLLARQEKGGTVAFVIDEAQNVGDQTLERLRLLSNIETTQQKLLQIVLVGQPELQDRLRQRHLRQLNERISVRTQLRPLSMAEMRRYVAHRLGRVGGDLDRICTPAARWLLLRRAGGIPRRANILFHNALLFAYGHGATRITLPVAREAVREMNDARIRGSWPAAPRWAVAATLLACAGLVLWSQTSGSRPMDRVAIPAPAPVAAAPEPPAAPRDLTTTDRHAAVTPPAAAAPPAAVAPTNPATARVDPTPATPSVPAPTAIDDPSGEVTTVRIFPGATLGRLARELYGADVPEPQLARLMDEILRLNPRVKDPDRILAGGTLRVPAVGTAGKGTP